MNTQKRKQVFQWLIEKKYSICLLQETHLTKKNTDKWIKDWNGKAFFSGNESNREGVAILFSNNQTYKISNYTEIIQGRLIAIDIEIDSNECTIINIYGPNNDDTQLFLKLEDYVNENDDKNFIIAGDFNTVLDVKKDKQNGRQDTHKKCRKKLNNLIEQANLIDIWRHTHKNKCEFTWRSNNNPPILSRLDYFLITNFLTNITKSCEIKPGFKTDHALITLNINFSKKNKGPGYFKINNSLLLEEDFQVMIRNSIKETVNLNNETNPNTMWELIKGNIRNETIKYSIYKNKKIKN